MSAHFGDPPRDRARPATWTMPWRPPRVDVANVRGVVIRRSVADDRGQAIPLVIGVVAVMAVLVLGVAWFGASLIDAAAARTAADAAALAGAVDGRSAAAELASKNGGQLVEFRQIGDDVIVSVRRGRAVVSSRATANRAHLSTLAFRDADQPAG